MADRQGFEPWRRSPAYTLSRRAPSTTRPPVHQRGLARPLGDLQEACATIKKRQSPSLQNLIRFLKKKSFCVLRSACKSFVPQTMPRNTETQHQSMRSSCSKTGTSLIRTDTLPFCAQSLVYFSKPRVLYKTPKG